MCTSVGVFNSLETGISGENLKFAGTGGSVYLLSNLKIELEKYENNPQASKRLNQMNSRQMNNDVTNFKASVKRFYDISKTTKFVSCKPEADPAKVSDLVKSTFVNSITDTIQNTAIFKKRYKDLTEYGESFGNFADSVIKYKTKNPTTLKSAFKVKLHMVLDLLILKLNKIQTSIKKVDSYFNNLIDYKKTRFNMIFGFVAGALSISGVIFFLLAVHDIHDEA